MDRRLIGLFGETQAALWLRKEGYEIVASNYRCRFGEIDIIAKNKKFLVFAEVKTRSPGSFGTPAEAVGKPKIGRILKTAGFYLLQDQSGLQPRFDVIEVCLESDRMPLKVKEIRHIPAAFSAQYGED